MSVPTGLVLLLLAAASSAVLFRLLGQRRRVERLQSNTTESLQRLAEVLADSDAGFEELTQSLLEFGSRELGMEIGALSRCAGSELEVAVVHGPSEYGLTRGDRFDPRFLFCEGALSIRGPLAIENAADGAWATHPARELHHFESYFGTTVRHGSHVYGTLYFASRQPHEAHFGALEKTLIEIMAHWVATALRNEDNRNSHMEMKRLQRAAVDFGALVAELPEAEDRLGAGLELVVKTLDLGRATLLAYTPDDDSFRAIASTGSGGHAPDAAGPETQSSPLGLALRAEDLTQLTPEPHDALSSGGAATATICVPIRLAGGRQGSLTVAPHEPRIFSDQELEYLRLVAQLMGSSTRAPEPQASEPVVQAEPAASVDSPTTAAVSPSPSRRQPLGIRWAMKRLIGEIRETPDTSVEIEFASEGDEVHATLYRYELDRILGSLMGHALRRTDRVRIATEVLPAPPESQDSSRFLSISVEAVGSSLDAAEISKLYDPDEGADNERELPPALARTLSLPRVERLLRDAGGDLSIHSDAERGTAFTAYLPLARA